MLGLNLFYSYAHQDRELRDELDKHLSILKSQNNLITWYDQEISAGGNWAIEIESHLEDAQIILLLISADFLASKYCYSVEMQHALERHKKGKAHVVPIILRPVRWQGDPNLANLEALPTNGKPVISWPSHDEAFENIAKGIENLVKLLSGEPPKPETPYEMPPPPVRKSIVQKKGLFLIGTALLIGFLLFSTNLLIHLHFPGDNPVVHTRATTSGYSSGSTTTPASSKPIYSVKNTDETPPDGIYFRHVLGQPDSNPINWYGVFKGDLVQVYCWAWGYDKSGIRGVWYYVSNVSSPFVRGTEIPNRGWISAHYVADGMAANHPAPNVPQCSSPLPTGG